MSDQSPFIERIPIVSDGVPRPLWSVMIPTYNCAAYLRETLASVLAQDPGPGVMQIEVVDDHSTQDDPAKVVEEVGRGRVSFYRQLKNVGHVRNFDTCLLRSQGHLVHLLHGDDCVRNGFYEKMQRAFLENPGIGAAFCRDIRMDERSHWLYISGLLQPESGILDNWLERIAVEQCLQTPSMVVKRCVYERLGGFDQRISYYGEDWEMWVRIAAHYSVWHEVEPLAIYRIHSASLSGRSVRTGEAGRNLRLAIEINKSHLPANRILDLSRQAKERFALASLRRAYRMLKAGEMQAPIVQMQEALKSSWSLNVLGRTFFLSAFWAAGKMYRALKVSINERKYDKSTSPQ